MQISIRPYQELEEQIRQIRETVFIQEQQVSREDEFDGRDDDCVQVLASEGQQLLGTGRLDPQKGGKVGRVAVMKEHRRKGIGKQIMLALESEAARLGLDRVWFHAQLQAVPFYLQLGYQREGEVFQEAGIDHVKMFKLLEPDASSTRPTQS